MFRGKFEFNINLELVIGIAGLIVAVIALLKG
jgi:hypothetical protein